VRGVCLSTPILSTYGGRRMYEWAVQGWWVRAGLLLAVSELPVTALLCRAAEAVLQGRAESILAYHQQNVPRAKLDQVSVVSCLVLR